MHELRKEIDALAETQGSYTEWNEAGTEVRAFDPKKGRWTLFSPPEIMRKALLPIDHPDATQLRPGTAAKHGLESVTNSTGTKAAALLAMIRNLDGQFTQQCQLVDDALKEEREACAKIVEAWLDGPLLARKILLEDIAASIRERAT